MAKKIKQKINEIITYFVIILGSVVIVGGTLRIFGVI